MVEANGAANGTPREYKPFSLADARERTPAPEGVGQWAEKLKAAALAAVGADDITEILGKQVEKAKAGDPAAAKFVLGFLAAQAPPVEKKVVVEKVKIIDRKGGRSKEKTRVVEAAPPEPVPVALDAPGTRQLRRLVGLYLKANHNARLAELETVLEIPAAQLKAVLNCDWFGERAGVWALSPEGNRNVG